MPNKLEQAARQALEALEQYHYTLISAGVLDKQHVLNQGFTAHAALREALSEPELNLNCKSVQKRLATVWGYVKAEQAEQEPVAYMFEGVLFLPKEATHYMKDYGTPLYAAPVRTKDLTDDEIADCGDFAGVITLTDLQFARAVIAADREKNK